VDIKTLNANEKIILVYNFEYKFNAVNNCVYFFSMCGINQWGQETEIEGQGACSHAYKDFENNDSQNTLW